VGWISVRGRELVGSCVEAKHQSELQVLLVGVFFDDAQTKSIFQQPSIHLPRPYTRVLKEWNVLVDFWNAGGAPEIMYKGKYHGSQHLIQAKPGPSPLRYQD
jgi:hypothetical protein